MSQAQNPEDLARHARRHLESLRASGVDWLPAAPAESAPLQVAAKQEMPAPNLFAEAPGEGSAPCQVAAKQNRPLSLEQSRVELKVLAQKVSQCTRCAELASTRTQTVFGVGNPAAELCFIGEAPGADEDRQGEPFVGMAGQLLDKIIVACGMKREDVYICNILRCRPPGNRQPLPNEAANCREYLDRQLEIVAPKFICCLGATAAQNLLGTTLSIGKLRSRFQDYHGIPVLCTYHPAYLLRSPEKKKEVWEDMQLLMERMGRPVAKAAKK